MATPSEDLREARRAVEHIAGCKIERDLYWHEQEKAWVLELTLRTESSVGSLVPSASRWIVLIADTYPLGKADFMPAKEGGLPLTFPHQAHNGAGDERLPWRQGRLCLEDGTAALDRLATSDEPKGHKSRLPWLVRRAQKWLRLASIRQLAQPGDPFELPQLPVIGQPLVAFAETAETFDAWGRCHVDSGYCQLGLLPGERPTVVVCGFGSGQADNGLTFTWGSWIEEEARKLPDGVWIRLGAVLHRQPWQIPETWSELAKACQDQGVDLLQHLRRLFPPLREHSKKSSEREPRTLLLGFPISKKIDDPPHRFHWLALRLPRLAAGNEFANGFRKKGSGYWFADLKSLSGRKALQWQATECWNKAELQGRGQAVLSLRSSKITMIGAGSLGSALAELLVREGVHALSLIDKETMDAGNLVRHSLTLEDVGASKALAVAQRLNRISPHARVCGFQASIEDLSEEAEANFEKAEIIIDCSGSDEVLRFLSRRQASQRKLYFSLSLGAYGRFIYCFGAVTAVFPWSEFEHAIRPWVEKDSEALKDTDLHRGLGCWHPALPVRLDAVWGAAAAGIHHLEALLQKRLAEPTLTVLKQRTEDGIPCLETLWPEAANKDA